MGKNKLKKFADMETFGCVFQFPWATIEHEGCPMRGRWNADYFGNDHPIVLELGCGKGEYAVGLGKRFPDKNYIGVDIKGSRMWTGARQVEAEGLKNVAFLRASIEIIDRMFAPGEVSEIWITFPDPQMKKVSKRLTSTRFMNRYTHIMQPGGLVHLKCDSNFLFTYTEEMARANQIEVLASTRDLYSTEAESNTHGSIDWETLRAIQTAYEKQWLARGKDIKYMLMRLSPRAEWIEPDVEIPLDDYRSYNRDKRSSLERHV